jgi:hypothetical protein
MHIWLENYQNKTLFNFSGRVFKLFADYWKWVEPRSVMEFNFVKQRFVERLEHYLARAEANLMSAQLDDLEPEALMNARLLVVDGDNGMMGNAKY